MNDRPAIDVTGGALAAGLFVGFAGAAFVALSWAATPSDYKARMAQAESRIASAEGILTEARAPSAFLASAVCPGSAERGALALKARVQSLAGLSGVTLASLAAAPMSASDERAIAPVSLQFEASGRYDQVVSMLAAMSRQTPTIFTDSADLTSQVSSVNFKFSGRIYCSARL